MIKGRIAERSSRVSSRKPIRLDRQWLAIQALTFLAGEEDLALRFFALAGLDAGTIRAAATEPGFLPGFLDVLIEDRHGLERFSVHVGCEPADIVAARESLRAEESWSGEDA